MKEAKEWATSVIYGKGDPGRGNSQYKGPEGGGAFLGCSRKNMKAGAAGRVSLFRGAKCARGEGVRSRAAGQTVILKVWLFQEDGKPLDSGFTGQF